MSAPDKLSRDMTDEEIYVRNAQQQVHIVAEKLEQLAARLRLQGEGMQSSGLRNGAVGVAADIVNEFTQGVGNLGTYLWGVVHNAQHLDRHRREQVAGQDRKSANR